MLSVIYAECWKYVLYAEFRNAECQDAVAILTNTRLGKNYQTVPNALA